MNNQQLNILPELPMDIEYLDVSFNNLKNIDVSKYLNLKYLNCSNNLLTFLIVNDNLQTLICKNNYLQTLNLNNIIELNCSNNLLTEINIKNINNCNKLIINDNKLNKLFYIPKNIFSCFDTLEYLNINNNYLQYYDLINYDKYNDFEKIILDNQLNNQLHLLPITSNSNFQNKDFVNTLMCENNKLYNHLNFINKGIIVIIPKNKYIIYCYTFDEINKLNNINDFILNDKTKLLLQIFNTFILNNSIEQENKLIPINLQNFINKTKITNNIFIPQIQDLILKNIKVINNDDLLFYGYTINNKLVKIYNTFCIIDDIKINYQ